MRVALTIALVGLAASATAASDTAPVNSTAHVRAMQKEGDALLTVGMGSSPTFRRLVNRLERSDVIVYVDIRPDMPAYLGGSLRFITRSATTRFLRVQLNRSLSEPTLVALLGHELQHAVEVAGAPDITTADGLRRLYRRVGVRTGPDTYDSVAARETGYTVRDELSHAGAEDLRLASATAGGASPDRSRDPMPADEVAAGDLH